MSQWRMDSGHEWSFFCAVKTSYNALKLQWKVIDTYIIGAHSLQAGGAKALKIVGYKDSTVSKFGRWMLDILQMYIHI